MFTLNIKKMVKIVLILAVFALIFNLNVTFLEASNCEMAFAECFMEHVYHFADFGVVYCGVGYFFCKKYIE